MSKTADYEMTKRDERLALADWIFQDGKYQRCRQVGHSQPEHPLESIVAAGYKLTQRVGDEYGLHYEVLSCTDDERCIVWMNTSCKYCEIIAPTWPDLIQLLAQLSPIITAATIGDQDLINLVHDFRRDKENAQYNGGR